MPGLRQLGPGLPTASVVGFGGMPLSIQGRPDAATAGSVLHAAFDAGITLVDTADVYCLDDGDIGHNERLIADALRTWSGQRERMLVATKGGLTRPRGDWVPAGRPEHLKRACERSLKALGVDRIVLYQLHAPDPRVPFAESVGALADLRREGKIAHVGLSNVSVAEIRLAQGLVPVAAVQNRLSPFARAALADGVVDYCAAAGIGFLAYSPVGGRRLSATLPAHPVLRRLAEKTRRSPHAIALAWVLAQSPTVFVIPGARTVEHVRDSVGAGELHLEREDLDAITAARFG